MCHVLDGLLGSPVRPRPRALRTKVSVHQSHSAPPSRDCRACARSPHTLDSRARSAYRTAHPRPPNRHPRTAPSQQLIPRLPQLRVCHILDGLPGSPVGLRPRALRIGIPTQHSHSTPHPATAAHAPDHHTHSTAELGPPIRPHPRAPQNHTPARRPVPRLPRLRVCPRPRRPARVHLSGRTLAPSESASPHGTPTRRPVPRHPHLRVRPPTKSSTARPVRVSGRTPSHPARPRALRIGGSARRSFSASHPATAAPTRVPTHHTHSTACSVPAKRATPATSVTTTRR
ncbi:hypothetical protein CLV68_2270 [Actinokineospora cianjurensis]|uniref:Uncharacterized protein n=1 Tax=Actinokineospora cianjurensis TaxID=585224 RepID=A0A421BBJ9_9PSEU|nr:hypothetical protein CLV68_2270 [Actinokineospora cianjurensis]